MTLDVLDLARDLIRRPSVTPADEGAFHACVHSITKTFSCLAK